jgi:AcrR family transcriptional regulator
MARKRGVTVEDVIAAAEEVADAEGLGGLTLAAVAQRVGVRSPSLYAHVEGLDGLHRLLALRAARELEQRLRRTARGREGEEALRSLAHAYRRFARRRPGLYAAVQRAVQPGEDDELYEALAAAVGPVIQALQQAGVPPGDLIHMARAFRSALHGFVDLERGSGFGMPESVAESFERLVELLLSGVRAAAGHPAEAKSRSGSP